MFQQGGQRRRPEGHAYRALVLRHHLFSPVRVGQGYGRRKEQLARAQLECAMTRRGPGAGPLSPWNAPALSHGQSRCEAGDGHRTQLFPKSERQPESARPVTVHPPLPDTVMAHPRCRTGQGAAGDGFTGVPAESSRKMLCSMALTVCRVSRTLNCLLGGQSSGCVVFPQKNPQNLTSPSYWKVTLAVCHHLGS